MLFQPIINSMTKLLHGYSDLGTDENPLEKKYLPTISAFESLLPYFVVVQQEHVELPSFVPLREGKEERMSFELLKSIKSLESRQF